MPGNRAEIRHERSFGGDIMFCIAGPSEPRITKVLFLRLILTMRPVVAIVCVGWFELKKFEAKTDIPITKPKAMVGIRCMTADINHAPDSAHLKTY